MSGIAGLLHLDGSPVDLPALHRIGEALSWRGTDGIGYWHSRSVGFAHAQFWTTPEAVHETQPLCSADGGLCLTFDGRIDNRREMLDALQVGGSELRDETDPGLLLAAYRLWGTNCLQHIIGDFALAVWDEGNRSLWCARDHIGIRPFYYVHTSKLFLFSSDVQSLVAHPAVSLAINEGMVAECLTRSITAREETLYRAVRRLPASGMLFLNDRSEFRIDSWWRPDFSLIRYRNDSEYSEHATQLIEQSIAARLRVYGGWGCQLSGGLDSSSVAVTAQMLLDRSQAGQRVATFSTVAPGKPWDESEYIDETARFANLASHFVPPFPPELNWFQETALWSRDLPDYPNGALLMQPVYSCARERGIRVILTGQGGNELFEGYLGHFKDLFLSGSWRQLISVAQADRQIYASHRRWPVFLARNLLSQFAPRSVLMFRSRRKILHSSFLSSQFVRRTHLADRLHAVARPDVRRYSTRAQQNMFEVLQSGIEAHTQEQIDRFSNRSGIEERHPLFDRRLVEFALRLPEDQRQRGPIWKVLLRNCMGGKLPESLMSKSHAVDYSDLFFGVLSSPPARQLMQDSLINSETDWLDTARYKNEFGPIINGGSFSGRLAALAWMPLGIDLWFKTISDKLGAKSGHHSR